MVTFAAGLTCCGTFFFLIAAVVVINVLLLVWVARDAKARGMDGAVIWMILVFFTALRKLTGDGDARLTPRPA